MLPGSEVCGKLSAIFMSSRVEVSLNTPAQLSLPLYLPDDETFASFWPRGITPLYWPRYKRVAREHGEYIYLWAREGAGRDHLLHAACASDCRNVEMR